MSVLSGEVHGFLGANGAGKSTLVKIPSGAVSSHTGEITMGKWRGRILTPRKVQQLGLATIFQEGSLVAAPGGALWIAGPGAAKACAGLWVA